MNNPNNLGKEGIIAGRQAQGRLKETPGALSIENSVTVNRPTHDLDSGEGSGTRFAGDRAQQIFLAQNPGEYQERVKYTDDLTRDPYGWKYNTEYDKGGTMGGEVA